eukprot:TRINITY_DN8813_c0_g1_i1.p1 TRINITY_DN8813_c0_g1~~TRINITY_DN8813_c0_g1_i1.p1  ORF type:complete len:104 (+),score=22.70 TRINITY_DN8813_c0_g1_i1:106-417(+)
MSGNITGGIVSINNSTVADCYFSSNNFLDYFQIGFCVAQQNGNVTNCIDNDCYYKVDNCSFCTQNNLVKLDPNSFDVSCQFLQHIWFWFFKNKNNSSSLIILQ